MSGVLSVFSSSIGRKLIMALSGLFLITFLIVHLSGNLLLFVNDGGVSFNEYTKFMTTNPLIKASELILAAGFIIHIFFAYRITNKNAKARPVKYAYKKDSANSNWFSRNMGLTGSVIFIFLAVHLYMFWGTYHFGAGEPISTEIAYTHSCKVTEAIEQDGKTIVAADSYIDEDAMALLKEANISEVKAVSMQTVVERSFGEWWIVLFYVVAMLLIGFHLAHGFQSSFKSAGASHRKYTPILKNLGIAFSIVVPLAFAAIPIYYYVIQNFTQQ